MQAAGRWGDKDWKTESYTHRTVAIWGLGTNCQRQRPKCSHESNSVEFSGVRGLGAGGIYGNLNPQILERVWISPGQELGAPADLI